MKKVKIIAVIILVVSVVGIGVLGAKKLLQVLEEKSTRSSNPAVTNGISVTPAAPEPLGEVPGTGLSDSSATSILNAASSPETNRQSIPEDIGEPSAGRATSSSGAGSLPEMAKEASSVLEEKWVAFAGQNGVNVREGPATTEKLLFLVGKGTKGTVTARQNGWSQIKWDFNRKSGWVRDDLLLLGPDEVMQTFVRPDGTLIGSFTPDAILEAVKQRKVHITPEVPKPAGAMQVMAPASFADVPFTAIASGEKWVAFAAQKGVNVRAGPATAEKLLFLVGKGTKGTVTARASGWSQIKWDFNRKSGWVRDDLLLMGPDEVMRNFVAPDGTMIASFTPDAMKKVTKKAREIAQNISVGVARPAPPSETVKGFSGGKLPEEATVLIDGAKLRDAPSTKAAVVGKLVKGVSVKVKNVKQVGKYQWFDVDYANGRKIGWTREDNLQF